MIISFSIYQKKVVFNKPALFKEFISTNKSFDHLGGNGASHLEGKFIKLIESKDYDTLKFCLDNMEEWKFKVEKQNIIIVRKTNYSHKMRNIFKNQIYQDVVSPLTIEVDFQFNNENYLLREQTTCCVDYISIHLLSGAVLKSNNEPLLVLKSHQNIGLTEENIKKVKITFETKSNDKPIVVTRSFINFEVSEKKDENDKLEGSEDKDLNKRFLENQKERIADFVNKSETEIIQTLGKPTAIYEGFRNYGKSKPLENIDSTLYYQLKSGELFIYIQNKVCVSSKLKPTGVEY